MKKNDFKNKSILILGLGKSALAAAELLHAHQTNIDFYDEQIVNEAMGLKARFYSKHEIYVGEEMPDVTRGDYDLCVISPGISLDRPLVKKILANDIPIIGEMELASRFFPPPYVAITGTNGKTTTTALVHHILQESGKKSLMAGNIGNPLSSEIINMNNIDIGVFEVSSYQLETSESFHPQVALLTNLTPDHMQRHKTMDNYRQIKWRIFENQQAQDIAILNDHDEHPVEMVESLKAKIWYFSTSKPVEGAFLRKNQLILNQGQEEEVVVASTELHILGLHNIENALGAICITASLGIDTEDIRQGLRSFQGLEHRQELVRVLHGVTYVNDSKATNVESAMMAVKSYENKVFVLLGGSKKNTDYGPLALLIAQRKVIPVVTGDTRDEIHAALLKADCQEIILTKNLEESLFVANKEAQAGDIVLLSPACPSFDAFTDFEHRGRYFKEIVDELV